MRHIEFFGLPGVGKSTTFRELCRNVKNRTEFIPEGLLLSRLRGDEVGGARFKWWVNRIVGRRQSHILGGRRKRYIEEEQELVGFYWRLLTSHRSAPPYAVDTRLLAAGYFATVLTHVKAIREEKGAQLCLVDEGFAQRLLSVFSTSLTADEVENYFSLVPKPTGIVCCVAPVDVVEARVLERTKVAGSHFGMTDQEKGVFIREADSFVRGIPGFAESAGIDTLVVDTTRDLKESVSVINKFLIECLQK